MFFLVFISIPVSGKLNGTGSLAQAYINKMPKNRTNCFKLDFIEAVKVRKIFPTRIKLCVLLRIFFAPTSVFQSGGYKTKS
jgi:hypothetical protein